MPAQAILQQGMPPDPRGSSKSSTDNSQPWMRMTITPPKEPGKRRGRAQVYFVRGPILKGPFSEKRADEVWQELKEQK